MHPTRRTTLAGLGLTLPVLAGLSACGGGKKPTGGAGSPSSLSVWALTGAKEHRPSTPGTRTIPTILRRGVLRQRLLQGEDPHRDRLRNAHLVFNRGWRVPSTTTSNDPVIDLTGKVDDVLSRTIEPINTVGDRRQQYGVPNNDTQPVSLPQHRPVREHSVTPPT